MGLSTMKGVSPRTDMSLRILVVEDQDDAREMLRELLEMMGATVLVASSVSEALVQIDEVPDVVLSDIGMPDADGTELARRLQSHPNRTRMRLVAMTGYVGTVAQDELIAAGFDEVFSKPLTPEMLEALVRRESGRARFPSS